MAKVIIEGSGNPLLDGEYPIDETPLTNREWHTIKQVSGVRPREFEDAIEQADNDLVVALAAIAVRRAGKNIPVDMLWDMEGGLIRLDLRGDEEEELPPAEPPSSNGGAASDGEQPPQPGTSSSSASENPVSTP